ncbi:MAG: hemolysin family protein [Candidatus Aminicenantales bacterium]|jgi:putative hemolysin
MPVLPALLFGACVLLSAFFASAETALIGTNVYTLAYLEQKGSRRAAVVKKTLSRTDDFLATILIGNTLANTAAASLATYIIASLLPGAHGIVLYATAATTLLLLFFSEINPKIYAAYNPLKLALAFAWPVRFFMFAFFPFVKAFTFLSSLIFRKSRERRPQMARALSEDETRALLTSGIKGMSAFGKTMINEILDLGSRPVREIMTPRPAIKALEIGAGREQILETVLSEEFSRFPVYRGRLDLIEGLIHTKDIIPFLVRGEDIELPRFLRKPFYIPESASAEKALLQMKEHAVHLAFVVDEFGNVEGILSLEDILEEIVGDIRDEYDVKEEDWCAPLAGGAFLIKGAAAIKDINERLPLGIPENADYTTLAGFFLYEFGRLPREKDALVHGRRRFVVERMNKRHISLIRIEPPDSATEARP